MTLPRLLLLAAAAAVIPSADTMLETIASVEDRAATYFALAGATIVTSELAPIFGGLASKEGQLSVSRVIFAVTLAGWLATSVLYVAGMLKWEWLRRRFPSTRSAGTVALRIVRRNPVRASFLVRYLFGGRVLLPMACGAARVPLPVYLPVSLLGSLAWTVTFTLVGIAFGSAAEQLLGRLQHVEDAMLVVGVVLALGVVVWWWRRRVRRAERRAGARREDG